MKRRSFLAAGAAALTSGRAAAQSAPAAGGQAKTLIYVPQANLASLDPVWTTALVTRNHAHLLWETLYGRDEKLDAKPQMLEGHLVEDGGLRWTMKLREGLGFHDGTPVLARDCVASIRRWMKRDPIGQTIEARMDELLATDDRTLVFRLKKPFSALPYALARTQPSPVIMPERLALTDPYKQVPEIIGSGPFRWVADEYVAGNRAVYARNDKYNPRPEPASFCAGGYRVHVDRVEWRIIPDAATAANALVNGEIDWLDAPLPDLLPMLRKSEGVRVEPVDIYGTLGAIRMNQLQGPTTNPAVRRAMLMAVDTVEVMTAVMGDDKSLFKAPVGFFLPGTPSFNDAGMEVMTKRHSAAEIREVLKAGGYNGERIVYLHPTDQTFYDAMSHVCVAAWQKVGLNIDAINTDWGTVVQRRTSREPLEKGGWSAFPSGFPAGEYRDPIFATNLRGNGLKAWFGWPDDPVVEGMRDRWMDSTDPAEQKRLDREIQARSFETVPFIPLGQYMPPAGTRKSLTGILKGAVPVFWNVRKG
ncbi:MAG: ABC transporter substrate-binding protein [Acetobacteraceae bacterium]|nr:ABC transporter substrate-binding protein [Acetobacteraceae bacterium]